MRKFAIITIVLRTCPTVISTLPLLYGSHVPKLLLDQLVPCVPHHLYIQYTHTKSLTAGNINSLKITIFLIPASSKILAPSLHKATHMKNTLGKLRQISTLADPLPNLMSAIVFV